MKRIVIAGATGLIGKQRVSKPISLSAASLSVRQRV